MIAAKPYSSLFRAALMGAVLVLTACAASGPAQLAPSEEDLARFERLPTVEAVAEVEKSLQQGREQKQLDFYAPEHYQVASQALAEAKAQLGAGSRETVIRKVATAEAVLRNGDRVMARIKDLMQPELGIKQRLDALGADDLYRPEYESVLKRLKQVIRDIETGRQEQAEAQRPALMSEMQALQMRSLRYNALHETEELLKRVKNRGAEKLAPVSYGEALEAFRLADETIQNGATDPAQIEQLAQAALFAARRALYVTQAVAALTQMVTISPEQVVLDEEYRLYRIARMLGAPDRRDHSLEAQSEQLAAAAAAMNEEVRQQQQVANILREAIINQVVDAEADLQRVQQSLARLEQERAQWQARQAALQDRLASLQAELAQARVQLAASETQRQQLNAQLAQQRQAAAMAAPPGPVLSSDPAAAAETQQAPPQPPLLAGSDSLAAGASSIPAAVPNETAQPAQAADSSGQAAVIAAAGQGTREPRLASESATDEPSEAPVVAETAPVAAAGEETPQLAVVVKPAAETPAQPATLELAPVPHPAVAEVADESLVAGESAAVASLDAGPAETPSAGENGDEDFFGDGDGGLSLEAFVDASTE